MNLHTYIPYNTDGNLGKAYNDFMKLVKGDDWVCFLDADATFTTRNYYPYMLEVIEKNSQYGLFTCMTNRIGCPWQKFSDVSVSNHDIKYHREIGKKVNDKHFNDVIDVTSPPNPNWPLSGVIILISKETWKNTGGFKDGFLGVDNDIHLKCKHNNINVGLIKGLYVYHWYRGDGDMSHVKTAESQVNHLK